MLIEKLLLNRFFIIKPWFKGGKWSTQIAVESFQLLSVISKLIYNLMLKCYFRLWDAFQEEGDRGKWKEMRRETERGKKKVREERVQNPILTVREDDEVPWEWTEQRGSSFSSQRLQ